MTVDFYSQEFRDGFDEESKSDLDFFRENRDKSVYMGIVVDVLEKTSADEGTLRSARREFGDVSLACGSISKASQAYLESGDLEGLRRTAHRAMHERFYRQALRIAVELDDPSLLERSIDMVLRTEGPSALEVAISSKLHKKLIEAETKYFLSKVYDKSLHSNLHNNHDTINAAYQLAPRYDVGIGVAKAGLRSSFMFNLFGLPIVVCEAHAHDEEQDATFSWIDEPQTITGNNVLIIENDVVTGRTMERVIKEIQQHNPSNIDLYLDIGPAKCLIRSILENIPEGVTKTLYPKMLSYDHFFEALQTLKSRLAVEG